MLWTSKELGSNTDKHCGEFEPGLDPRRLDQCWSIIYDHRGKTEPMSQVHPTPMIERFQETKEQLFPHVITWESEDLLATSTPMGAESSVPLRIVQWLVPNEQTKQKYTLECPHCPERERTSPPGEVTPALPRADV